MTCPCTSGLAFDACCGPYLRGEQRPPTALAQMRARYAAYATGAVDYIFATQEAGDQGDRASTEAWSRESNWLGLQVIKTTAGEASDDEGTVEFIARYLHKGQEYAHHEEATFRRKDAAWVLVDGRLRNSTFRRTQAKVGPNDPCPCGSGRKSKKCCGKR